MKGKVYLVGQGPGDFDLLTIKAERLIKSADVIVHDGSVDGWIFDMAKSTAVFIDISKDIDGEKYRTQAEINSALVALAGEYEAIVRLKSGDPILFDRSGEELSALARADIPFEVVPGVTSVTAVATYAGIPITHSEYTSSLSIISAKDQAHLCSMDFKALVQTGGTLVFMSATKNAMQIQQGLVSAGADCETPCAIIENGTRSSQRKFITTLGNLDGVIKENHVKSPAVILVGEVVKFSDTLDWFSVKPLKNVSILATQKAKNSSGLIPRLKESGADIAFCPMIQTTSTLPQSFDISKYTAIAFSSMQSVDSFFHCLARGGQDARALFGKKIACIGTQTAKSAKAKGVLADFIPEVFSGKDMANGMIKAGMLTVDDNILLVRAQDGTQEILEVLNQHGIKYDDMPIYKTEYLSQSKVEDIDVFDYITFTSKSSVESFVKSQQHLDFSNAIAICIGDQTAEYADMHGFKGVKAKDGSTSGVVEEIIAIERLKKVNEKRP